MNSTLCKHFITVIFCYILTIVPLYAEDTLKTPVGEIGYGGTEGLHLTKNAKYIITRARPGKVRIWSVETAKLLTTITAASETDYFVSSDILPGDSLLVTGTSYGNVSIWHIPDGILRASFSFTNKYGGFGSITASPDGTRMLAFKERYLTMISTDGAIDTSFKSSEYIFDIGPVIFSFDGSQFAAVSNRRMNIYNSATGGVEKSFYYSNPSNNNGLGIRPYEFSPDGSQILCLYQEADTWGITGTYVGFLDIATGKKGIVLKAPKALLNSRFLPDGTSIISGTYEEHFYLHDPATGDTVSSFTLHPRQDLVAISGDGKYFMTHDTYGNIFLLDSKNRQQVATIQGFESFGSFDISPDGNTAVSSSGKIWDVATKQYSGTLQDTGFIQSAVFTHDGTGIVTSSGSGTIALWDLTSRSILKVYSNNSKMCFSLAASPQGNMIAAATGSIVKIFDKSSGDSITCINLPNATYAVKFSPDGSHIAAGYGDSLMLWDIDNHTVVWRQSAGASVRCISFSPDGTMLAVGAIYRDAVIYSSENGDSLLGIPGSGYSVAWAHNGRYVACSNFSYGHLYDVKNTAVVQCYITNPNNISSASCATAFSADDSKLFTAIGGTLQIWDIAKYSNTLHKVPSLHISAMALTLPSRNTIRLALNGHRITPSLKIRIGQINGRESQSTGIPGAHFSDNYVYLKPVKPLVPGLYYYIIQEQKQLLGSGMILLNR